MSDEYYDNNTLAVIGAIIVVWASIEKQVAGAVRWIEVGEAMAAKSKYANYVDFSKFRSFKERKGHLRKLVEKHGTKEELSNLDRIYKKLVEPNRDRLSKVSVPSTGLPMGLQDYRHRLPLGPRVDSLLTLDGLHHEYAFQQAA